MAFKKVGENKFVWPAGKQMTMKQIKIVYSGRRTLDKVQPKTIKK